MATVNDAIAATGKTSTLPGNKCITVDEMNAMIGSSSDREIPIVALKNLMESGVSLLVLDYTTGDNPIGMINLESNGYSDSYDLQSSNTAVCLNVGSRGDLTSVKSFSVSFESIDSSIISLKYFGFRNQTGNCWNVEAYETKDIGSSYITMDNTYFSILAIAERWS